MRVRTVLRVVWSGVRRCGAAGGYAQVRMVGSVTAGVLYADERVAMVATRRVVQRGTEYSLHFSSYDKTRSIASLQYSTEWRDVTLACGHHQMPLAAAAGRERPRVA